MSKVSMLQSLFRNENQADMVQSRYLAIETEKNNFINPGNSGLPNMKQTKCI
jgi:hypothetical protein